MTASSELKDKWFHLTGKYTEDKELQQSIIEKIIRCYSAGDRHYHDLSHILKMFETISDFEDKLSNPDAVLFAIWFHDIVYDPKKQDNEAQSAEFAKTELGKFISGKDLISAVVEMILRTKDHTIVYKNESQDMQLFLDTDLVILGSSQNEYVLYMQGVRKEYHHVPSLLYRIGRKKILKKFLDQEFIYRTNEFRQRFEKNARQNIRFEIDQL